MSDQSEQEGWVALGRITRAHGVRGELRVQPYWAEGTTLYEAPKLWLRKPNGLSEIRVVGARPVNRGLLIQLEGIADRNSAEALRGLEICVPRSALPPLEAGEYYLIDLIGARVECGEQLVGVVVELRTHPSVDSVIIRTEKGKLREQVLAEPWIEKVDTASKLVRLTSLDGLI